MVTCFLRGGRGSSLLSVIERGGPQHAPAENRRTRRLFQARSTLRGSPAHCHAPATPPLPVVPR